MSFTTAFGRVFCGRIPMTLEQCARQLADYEREAELFPNAVPQISVLAGELRAAMEAVSAPPITQQL